MIKYYEHGNYSEELARRFREERKKQNLTIEELAEKLGVSVTSVANYEHHRRKITKNKAKAMANICGIDENYLLDESVMYPNQNAQISAVLGQANREGILLHNALLALFELNGYEVTVNEIKSNCQLEEALEGIKKHLTVNNELNLSLEETNKLGNAVNDLFMVLLKRYYNL